MRMWKKQTEWGNGVKERKTSRAKHRRIKKKREICWAHPTTR